MNMSWSAHLASHTPFSLFLKRDFSESCVLLLSYIWDSEAFLFLLSDPLHLLLSSVTLIMGNRVNRIYIYVYVYACTYINTIYIYQCYKLKVGVPPKYIC